MKKQRNVKRPIPKLLIVGAILLFLTPLVQPIAADIITANCPIVYGIKECGLEGGVRNAAKIEAAPIVWLGFVVLIIIVGIVLYVKNRKSA